MFGSSSHGWRLSAANLDSRLNPFTLRFTDTALEAAYQSYHVQSVLQVMRFGLLLAVSLYLFYGVIDQWAAPEHLRFLWSVRLGMSMVLLAALGLSWRAFFVRHQQVIGFALVVSVGITVCAILAVMPLHVMNQQNTALVLVIVGGFMLMGLQFVYAVSSGMLLALCYLLLEVFIRDNSSAAIMMNMGYMVSATILASLGAHAADKHRRLAYRNRLQVDYERAESQHLSLHDALTGLPNRRLMMEKLAQAVARDDRFNTRAAVLFIDLDHFKAINDTQGHAFGDSLLEMVARRLKSCVRTTDTVSRFGGDEFVVLLEDLLDEVDVQFAIQRINECFAKPCDVNGVLVDVSMSVGQALHPRDGNDPDSLLVAADNAMYEVKRRHGRR